MRVLPDIAMEVVGIVTGGPEPKDNRLPRSETGSLIYRLGRSNLNKLSGLPVQKLRDPESQVRPSESVAIPLPLNPFGHVHRAIGTDTERGIGRQQESERGGEKVYFHIP
jgi:hypothetical protein